MPAPRSESPQFLAHTNLAQPRLGAEVVFANDDFFAEKSRLISPHDPVFIPDKYDDHGKWMDGWESRRKRGPGHDFCIIKLGRPAQIAGFEIDTRHFTGNYPPAASLDACRSDAIIPEPSQNWTSLTKRFQLDGDDRKFVDADSDEIWTHVRLNIFPDGGVARLRIFGRFHIDWCKHDRQTPLDLAAMELGGRAVGANDQHFGEPGNLIAPGRGVNMGDGWETRRRRTPGHDWAVIELAQTGVIEEVVIDTAHFKGNYPDRFSLQASAHHGADAALIAEAQKWPEILPPQKLNPDREHRYTSEITRHGPVRYVRLNIFPDGGVSRLRLIGKIASEK